ncbi:MAG: nuclear transport factor 2 family protein [Reyranella sp.]|nr:nuclear transport factor 2 family protein [Reyranella sp.]
MITTRRRQALAGGLILSASAVLGGPAVFAQSADAQAVDKAVAELRDAMLAADGAKLAALLSDQLSYGHSAGRLETKAQFLDIVAGKKTLYKSIAFSDATTSVAGNNAIVRHVMTVDVETDGKPATAKVGALQVWVKDGGAWKLLARQAFRL